MVVLLVVRAPTSKYPWMHLKNIERMQSPHCLYYRGFTNIPAWPASEAALHIITSGATRQTESYYPWFWYYGSLIRDWFPYLRDISIRNFYKY